MILPEKYMGIVSFLAGKYGRARPSLIDDLKGEGYLTLVKAVQSFDPAKHCRGEDGLTGFLFKCVKRSMVQLLKKEMRATGSTTLFADLTTDEEITLDPADRRCDSPVALASYHELTGMVRKQLPALTFKCWYMYHIEGSRISEIVAYTRESKHSVMARLETARTRLSKCLDRRDAV